MKLGDLQRVTEVFQQTNGVFQNAVLTNSGVEWVPRGYLLLAEAQLEQKDYPSAEAALKPLSKVLLKPDLAWQWEYVLCRIQLAQSRTDEALVGATNLLQQAAASTQRELLAESYAFLAGIYERLDQPDPAIAAYEQNLADGVPVERQREALLKITELALAQNKIAVAVQKLERFLAQFPDAAMADLAFLTVGELRLRQFVAGMDNNRGGIYPTNSTASTNLLQDAVSALDALTSRFPQSHLLGKAQLDLGWCYWLDGKMRECQAAFQTAVQHLPASPEQATAYIKLARSEEHTSELQSPDHLVCRLLLEKKNN